MTHTKSIVIKVIVLIILVLIAWGIVAATSKKAVAPVQENVIATTTESTPELKTYTNTQYGISLQYPSNWVLNEKYKPSVIVSFSDIHAEGPVTNSFAVMKECQNASTDGWVPMGEALTKRICVNSLGIDGVYSDTYAKNIEEQMFSSLKFTNATATAIPWRDISVVSPEANDSWKVGSTQTIAWNKNSVGDLVPSIELIPDGKSTGVTIAEDVSNTGTYTWKIPTTTAPGNYTVLISAYPSDGGKIRGQGSSAQFTIANSSSSSSDQNPTPYIGSIIPNSAAVGTTLTLTGSGLIGFEGDVYFFFQRADGKVARLKGTVTTQTTGDATGAQTAHVLLKEPCQPGETVYGEYSGAPSTCDYIQLTPGIYKVYTAPWGKNSNAVPFTITN